MFAFPTAETSGKSIKTLCTGNQIIHHVSAGSCDSDSKLLQIRIHTLRNVAHGEDHKQFYHVI